MDPATQSLVVPLKLLLDFVGQHIWSLIALVFLIIARKAITGFVERVIKLAFSWGGASGSVEAAPPTPASEEGQRSEPVSKASQPSSSNPELTDLKEKKEEAKDWFPQMYQAFIDGEIEQAKRVFEAHQRKEQDANRRHSNEALFLHFLYTYGNDATALPRLEELHARSANDEQRSSSTSWLSWSYDAAKDYEKAEKLWRDAISTVTDEGEKTSFIINLAHIYKNMGEAHRGVECLEDRLQEVTELEQRAPLYQALSTLEKERGNGEMAAIALEKVVELSPGNREKLFDAAYAQSEVKLRLLSVSNYRTLLNLSHRHAAALNNLGVCAGEFELTGKQVSLYKRSMNEEYTLAMANLANSFINGGFWNEAKEILDKARVAENPHENVGNALYRLQSFQDDEDKKWGDLTKKAEKFQRRVREYCDACFDKAGLSFDCSGVWYTQQGEEVIIKRDGKKIEGNWTEKLAGLGGTSIYKVSIHGSKRNRSVALTYHRRPESERPASLLGGSLAKSIKCYSYFTPDRQVWKIFSKEPNEKLTLTLRRKAPN